MRRRLPATGDFKNSYMARRKRRIRTFIRKIIGRRAEITLHIICGSALITAAGYFAFQAAVDYGVIHIGNVSGRNGQDGGNVGILSFAEIPAVDPESVEVPADDGRTDGDPTASNSSPLEGSIRSSDEEVVTTDTSGDWRLILVNPTHKLPDDFWVDTEVLIDEDTGYIDERIHDAVIRMLTDCENAGYHPVIRAAYRTHKQQQELYDDKVRQFMNDGESEEQAKTDASTIIALPGTSEHELGLALDIVSKESSVLNEAQENTETQQWLMEHCAEYGFVLRYPSDKSSITGIIYEPWHYRYVGTEAAKIMSEEDLCLEEYLEIYGNEGDE